MQHTKLTYRIPYPQILHIEDSQIYHAEDKTEIEEEKEEAQADTVGEDLTVDNKSLISESHMGSKRLQELSKKANVGTNLEKSYKETAAKNNSYDLGGIVVHYGSGMRYGHYWSLARSAGKSPLDGS